MSRSRCSEASNTPVLCRNQVLLAVALCRRSLRRLAVVVAQKEDQEEKEAKGANNHVVAANASPIVRTKAMKAPRFAKTPPMAVPVKHSEVH